MPAQIRGGPHHRGRRIEHNGRLLFHRGGRVNLACGLAVFEQAIKSDSGRELTLAILLSDLQVGTADPPIASLVNVAEDAP